ncbi:alpha/beta hydrolase [Vibrio neonatus]|uniref:alpha/beta hydrolase n=1 Tax=Vibrio neonatus TaxID=278860 RepID=UPI0021C3C8FB|nr:alpha/beta fold hydrolase [Vibrio neonatus]
MRSIHKIVALGACLLIISGCDNQPESPEYIASDSLAPYMQSNYQDYLQQTHQWLAQHRVYVSNDKDTELNTVMPFEIVPEHPNGQGVLLVHGLGDSPYFYHDIAPVLAADGFLVRVILLPGHGSKPADLSLPELEDWQQAVSHQYQLLSKKVDGVWLGGFSTGANLVTALAYQKPEIKGLLLFSPAFKPRNALTFLSPLASKFVNWESKVKEDNYTRYNSLHMKGAATYYGTSQLVRDDLEQQPYTKPTFMMLSEADETIDSQFAVNTFSQQFTNLNSEVLWFGETQFDDPRITSFSMHLPEQKILSASHVSLGFSPNNPMYKRDGKVRFCFHQQPVDAPKDCTKVASDQVWFASYGDGDESMVRARTSWNPYFAQSMHRMSEFLQRSSPAND